MDDDDGEKDDGDDADNDCADDDNDDNDLMMIQPPYCGRDQGSTSIGLHAIFPALHWLS